MSWHRKAADISWQSSLQYDIPRSGQVHLWRFDLDILPKSFQDEWLNQAEQKRVAAFYSDKLRFQMRNARAYLKQTLGNYLRLRPAEVPIDYLSYGKPFLPDYLEFQFNLSHSDHYALLGITSSTAIGVDVEYQNEKLEVVPLVERFFSPSEVRYILNCTAKQQAFFRAWTRKEAIIKAEGSGLQLPLNEFGVSIAPEDPVRLLHMDWAPEEVEHWQLFSFELQAQFPAAFALRDELKEIEVSFFEGFQSSRS